MIRRPPRSTLFPTRRSSDLLEDRHGHQLGEHVVDLQRDHGPVTIGKEIAAQRSEEHTSELQSRLHLVCRLLLEKKKIKSNIKSHQLITGTPVTIPRSYPTTQ